MHVSRSEIDDYLPARDVESEGLQGSYRTEEALFDGHVDHADKMDPYSLGYVNFDGDRYRLYADAFGGDDIH